MKTDLGSTLVIGEVLYDVFPDKKLLGGASFNFAFHLHGLGLPVIFISRVGDDDGGKEFLDFARRFDFPLDGIQIDPDRLTGEVGVFLNENGDADFDIAEERAFDFIEYNNFSDSLMRKNIPLIYIGTMCQRSPTSFKTTRMLLENLSSESMVVADLNLRPPYYDKDVVEFTLNNCDVLKVSSQEMADLHRLLGFQGTHQQMSMYLRENYEIGTLCITKGEKGSELYEAGDFEPHVIEAVKVESLKDTVGAGDAYSAMLTAGLLKGWDKQKILEKASEFSASVCGLSGALPSEPEFYQPYRIN
jgi:fructokinase